MGACHQEKADRTRFIINEDFKIKKEMIQTIEEFTKKNYKKRAAVLIQSESQN